MSLCSRGTTGHLSWIPDMVTVLDVFHGCVVALSVSFMSKYYKANELGRLQAVNSAFSLLFPFAFPAYNAIFQSTLDGFPSSFCFLSIVMDLGIIICFCVSYSFSKKIATKKSTDVEGETHKMMAGQ
ncbi:uncharacterized protein LOC135843253 [Planococcus citri]|uniref:uncharacterized protein LOC135843253 n=1 Tax=Planococcus citri TaxID=170843 RepID=UPI0031F87979